MKAYKLSDLCVIKYGKDHKGLNEGPIPVYGSGGVIRYVDRALSDKPSVLIPRKGTLSNLFYVDKPFWTVDTLFWTEINNSKVIPKYLYYLLSTRNLASLNVGTAVPSLTAEILNEVSLELPDLDNQAAIVDILSSFDNKIFANNRINDYLEKLATAFYKDFISDTSGEMGALSDLVNLRKNPLKVGVRNDLPYMPIDIIPSKSIGVSGFKPNSEAKSSLQLFQKDDIVIGAMRVYFHRVVLAPCEGITRNTCFVLTPKNQWYREYALLTCFQVEAIEYANARSKGSTMPYAVWENSFERYPVLIPSETKLKVFSRQLAPIIDTLRDSYKEATKLAELRDELLPKLISGEIDVSKIDLIYAAK